MEQLRHLVVVFVFVVFLISCQRDNESVEHYKKFTENGIPKRKDIKSKKLYFPEVITPLKIIIKDDYLVLSESRRISSEKPLLHIIDLKRGEYVQGKGVVGFGPGEIPDVFHLEEGLNPKTFWVASGMGKTFSEFSLDDSSKYANRQIKQEEEFYMASQYSLASDSTL